MRGASWIALKIGASLLLSLSLVSCNASTATIQPQPPPTGSSFPSVATAKPVQPISDTDNGPTQAPVQSEKTPLPSPTPSDSEKSQATPTPAVEASNLQTPSTITPPEDPLFDSQSPSLAGIHLGNTDKSVVKRFGPPIDTYQLPGDGEQSIEIWEYKGISIGLNAQDKVVYVEINSSQVDTGIRGLSFGMNGDDAARLLETPHDERTNVVTAQVSGGWMKLDLDPDTRKVLSLKLLDEDL